MLAPPGQDDDAAPLPSPRCISVAASFGSSTFASAECHRQTTIARTRGAVGESSYPLHRWLDQDRSQEPWSTPGLHWNRQEPSFVIQPDNVVLAVEQVRLRARL
jgi:hypothetical protein